MQYNVKKKKKKKTNNNKKQAKIEFSFNDKKLENVRLKIFRTDKRIIQ